MRARDCGSRGRKKGKKEGRKRAKGSTVELPPEKKTTGRKEMGLGKKIRKRGTKRDPGSEGWL